MATLSAVIITYNEETNIAACLTSVAWADELIVMDSGSTDRTLDICREFGAKVFHQPWLGYAAQKNAAIALASQDWILSLDADERVTPELAAAIRAVLSGPEPAVLGYQVRRRVFFRNKWLRHGGFYPERLVRLIKRGYGRFGDRAVHEALELNGRTGRLEYDLEHYTYRSVTDYVDRMQRYSTLAAQEYHKSGRKTGPCRMAGRSIFTFFQMYVLRLGFLDGYEGFLMAGLYAIYTFVKYAKLREIDLEDRGD
ncbi:MAG: glycosyltransferase family 2 protein [Deltaproteobacteria bacterium]|nr:glycosyltransferase family 2 protein [Deltaproteobacteria bacterium]